MMLQIKRNSPRGAMRDVYYSPERDVAYVGVSTIAKAIGRFDARCKQYREEGLLDGVEESHIAATVTAFGAAFREIINGAEPFATLQASGFDPHPSLRRLLFAAIGEEFVALVWAGVKDVHAPDDSPPATVDEILAAAAEFSAKLS